MRGKRRKVLLITYCLVLIIGMFSTYPSAVGAEESVREKPDVFNGNFEEPVQIPNWHPVTNHVVSELSISEDYAFSGSRSLHFYNSSNEEQLQIASEKILVEPGEEYIAKAQAYVIQQTHSLGYEVHYYNENDEKVGTATFINFPRASMKVEEWNALEVPFTVPEEASYVQLRFNSGRIAVTEAYIDEISLETSSGESVTVANASFEEEVIIPGWRYVTNNTKSEISLNQDTVNNGKYSLHFNNPSNEEQLQISSEKIKITSGVEYTAIASVNVVSQSHSLGFEVHFFNEEGNKTGDATFKLFRAADLGQGKWTEINVPFIAPEGTTHVELRFNSGKIAVTEVFIDDVSITDGEEEIEEPTDYPEEVTNADFDQDGELVGWTVENEMDGVSISSERARSGTQSLHFHDTSDVLGLRVFSDPIAVQPGKSYLASVFTNVVNQTHNIVYEIYYYDNSGKQVGHKQELFGNLPKNQWTEIRVFTDVPSNATYARLAFYSGGISLTETYFDDVSFELVVEEPPMEREYAPAKNLGKMVHVQLGQAGVIQKNKLGENEVYYHSNGVPGTFSVLDAETGELKFSQVIPNTEALWAMTVGADQNVYFAGTGDGKLYRYVPELKEVQELGVNPSDMWVWDLEATEDGKIYGATYPNASVFEYDIETGKFRNFGRIADEDYARGIAVTEDSIYVAIGAKRHLYKVDRVTGEKEEIIIEGYSGEEGFFEDVYIINGKLLVSSGSINMLVIDPSDYSIINTFQYSNTVSQPHPDKPSIIYYKFQDKFYQYDFETNKSSVIDGLPILPDTVRVKDMEWLTLSSGEEVLAFITQYGEYMQYNPTTNKMNFIELDIAASAVAIQVMETGFDGRIYMGGYQRGMSIYNPFTKEIDVNLSSFAQPEGIGFLHDKVYYGTYVGAIMYSYDPLLPIDLNTNPNFEYDITDQQDRPFAITSGDDKLFVGTIPDYGVLGGVLAIYDASTDTWVQHRNVVENQSIIGLAYHNGKLYGGTSVWGGLGIDPKEEAAKIFVWDVEKGEKITEFTPEIPGIDATPRMIGELSIGPDGNLWGAIEGTIFKMDPDTLEVLASRTIRPSLYNSSKWLPYRLVWAPDGTLYTTLSRKLIAIDPETLNYQVIVDSFMNNMTVGVNGSIYYALEDEMYEIEVPETDATLEWIRVNGEPLKGFSPGILYYEVNDEENSQLNVEVGTTQEKSEVIIETLEAGKKVLISVTAPDKKSKLQYTVEWKESSTIPEDEDTDDDDEKDEEEVDDEEDEQTPEDEDQSDEEDSDDDQKDKDQDKEENKDDKDKDKDKGTPDKEKPNNGDKLPNTATNYYNVALLGGFLLLLGCTILFWRRYKVNKG